MMPREIDASRNRCLEKPVHLENGASKKAMPPETIPLGVYASRKQCLKKRCLRKTMREHDGRPSGMLRIIYRRADLIINVKMCSSIKTDVGAGWESTTVGCRGSWGLTGEQWTFDFDRDHINPKNAHP